LTAVAELFYKPEESPQSALFVQPAAQNKSGLL
jgi:hypothetical protein